MICRQMGKRFPVSETYWTVRRGLVALGVAFALGLLAACTSTEPPPSNPGPVIVPGKPGEEASTIPPGEATGMATPEPEPNDADVTFIKNMIVHHQSALWMSELAPDRASSKNVKELASRIHDVQGLEIDAMNRWLSQHSVPTVNPTAPDHGGGHSSMPGMPTQDQLQQLENARGEAFDTLFLQLMIAHHEGAITMAKEVATTGVDVRVQEIAGDVVVEQTDEIQRMRGWLNG
jgi:uncharacterized protein (DUF305 family)